MNPDENDRLQRLVDTLLRQPEPADDLDARRALTRLTAARPDAAYLLLQRALVLELALARVKAQQAQQAQAGDGPPSQVPSLEAGLRQAAGAAAAGAPPAGRTARALPRPSPFVRDAATIAAGVVAGGLVLGGLDALGDSLTGDGDMDLDLGLDDWL
jgi:hypothetical protein